MNSDLSSHFSQILFLCFPFELDQELFTQTARFQYQRKINKDIKMLFSLLHLDNFQLPTSQSLFPQSGLIFYQMNKFPLSAVKGGQQQGPDKYFTPTHFQIHRTLHFVSHWNEKCMWKWIFNFSPSNPRYGREIQGKPEDDSLVCRFIKIQWFPLKNLPASSAPHRNQG